VRQLDTDYYLDEQGRPVVTENPQPVWMEIRDGGTLELKGIDIGDYRVEERLEGDGGQSMVEIADYNFVGVYFDGENITEADEGHAVAGVETDAASEVNITNKYSKKEYGALRIYKTIKGTPASIKAMDGSVKFLVTAEDGTEYGPRYLKDFDEKLANAFLPLVTSLAPHDDLIGLAFKALRQNASVIQQAANGAIVRNQQAFAAHQATRPRQAPDEDDALPPTP
jgi:hypothetical protein